MELDDKRVQDALPWLLAGTAFAGIALVTVAALKTVREHENKFNTFSSHKPTFQAVKTALLAGLRASGWHVVDGLKTPHATKGSTRLWFKSQAVYINDPGTDPRDFANAHSMSSDMREFTSIEQFLRSVEHWST